MAEGLPHTDAFEYQTNEGDGDLLWDVQAWVGSDYNKLWFKSEGTWLVDGCTFEEAEAELFYSRNIATYWDLPQCFLHPPFMGYF